MDKGLTRFDVLKRELPPVWKIDSEELGREFRAEGAHKVVVLDDDPTGTQTVADVRVITSWDFQTLCRNLSAKSPAFYILTNSRSLSPEKADALALELGELLARAACETKTTLTIVSRGDSTLRGHFPGEVFALQRGLDRGGYTSSGGVLLVSSFFEGGRYTLADMHWVHVNGDFLPVGETEFARDPAFGFKSSRLPDWVEEKSKGTIKSESVRSVDLETIRRLGPDGVVKLLQGMGRGDVAVVNSLEYADLEVVAAAYWELKRSGEELIVRSAASFVPVLAGIASGRRVSAEHIDWSGQRGHGILVVVGSHVELTNRQLADLLKQPDAVGIEVPVQAFRHGGDARSELAGVHQKVEQTLLDGRIAVVYTSRDVLKGEDADEYLDIGERISDALADLVASLTVRPTFIVAKGGITSSDVATKGLSCREATVLGQVVPGVPVWHMGSESKFPDIPYVVFPGNVGAPSDLTQVVYALGAGAALKGADNRAVDAAR